MWVSPFRDLRIKGYLLLPEAFRSLSRLSSALSAKASPLRSFMHNQLEGLPRERDSFHTCIALHVLVIGQFILSLFSSDWIIVNVVNITSDVLYKIFILYH